MAGTTANIVWIDLRDVPKLVVQAYRSPAYLKIWTKEQLTPALVARRVEWQATAIDPADKSRDGFWQQPDAGFDYAWQENKVTALVWHPGAIGRISGPCLIGVRFVREDIKALLPATEAPAQQPVPVPAPAPTPPLMQPKKRFQQLLEECPRGKGEGVTDYARRLWPLLQATPLTKPWQFTNLTREIQRHAKKLREDAAEAAARSAHGKKKD
jgi:hypothetical protein